MNTKQPPAALHTGEPIAGLVARIEKLTADKREMLREISLLCDKLKEAETDRDFARRLLPKDPAELVALLVKAEGGEPVVTQAAEHAHEVATLNADLNVLRAGIALAIETANGRETEWGHRAETAFDHLRAAIAATEKVKATT